MFRHYIPHKLSGLVELIWEYRINRPMQYTVLPSGRVQLIFVLSSGIIIDDAKLFNEQSSPLKNFCFLSGLHTRPIRMKFNYFHCIGIQMKPMAVKALFGLPLSEIRDFYVEGETIIHSLNEIEDKLNSIENFEEKANWLEGYLLSSIFENAELHTAIKISSATYSHLRQQGQRVDPMEDLTGYSRTQTYRIFNDWFGLGVNSYQKLIQFVNAVESLHKPSRNLSNIAFENGYFDQSHFIRSFKKFSDMTPGGYRKNMTHLPGQLFH